MKGCGAREAPAIEANDKEMTGRTMEAGPIIRRATSADCEETAAMFSRSLRSMPFFPKLHSDEEDRAFVRRFIENDETWIALRDGRIVGVACLEGDMLAHLYVDPEHRNCGVGAALLGHVKSRRPRGFELWTFQANAGACRFYERHGCVAAEFTDGSRNEENLPDVRYASRG